MAYTDDAVKAKLSALNETQESIVTVAQWVMFHRRHADRTAQLWLEKIRDSNAHKKLNLVYLANEVVQQSKARRKEDFLIAFSPIIAEATAIAYKGSTGDIQQKIRRVVEIWRQRHIFDDAIQDAVEGRVDDIDRTKSTGKKPLLGGSLFTSKPPTSASASSSSPSSSSASIPTALQPLVPLQLASSKASAAATSALSTSTAEYDKLQGPNAPTPLPTPPVYAARLSQLLKTLAHAENSVSESIRSREALVETLERMVGENKAGLEREREALGQVRGRRERTEGRKREVEDAIMRGLATEGQTVAETKGVAGEEVGEGRPVVEALTPPPVEALTPVGSPGREEKGGQMGERDGEESGPASASAPAPAPATAPAGVPDLNNLLQVLGGGNVSATSAAAAAAAAPHAQGESSAKRRKVSQSQGGREGEEGERNGNGDAMEGLDDDVAELLRQESQKYPGE